MKWQKFSISALCICCFVTVDVAIQADEIQTHRVNVQVDGGRPLAGERSCFAVSPNGEITFTWTLVAGDFDCKPLGIISTDGRITYSAIDSETTWNVEGWASFGHPSDLVYDRQGRLHVATRFHGLPYGVDYWHQVDGQWRLETFGQNVTFGGNNVALGLLPGNRPVVVCMTRDRSRLAVWERTAGGQWNATRPTELQGIAAGHFDFVVSAEGLLQVVSCPQSGGPKCATRDATGNWHVATISEAGVCRNIAATSDSAGTLHVSFAAGESGASIRDLHYAQLAAEGTWTTSVVAQTPANQHVGRTDIAVAATRKAIVWERGAGSAAVSKDYGAVVGSVELTLIDSAKESTTQTVAESGGRPSLALTPDGRTAWVGVYSGNAGGDDFYVLNCNLAGGEPDLIEAPKLDAQAVFAAGCLRDINSGNELAMRRGIQRLDMSQLPTEQRLQLISQFLANPDATIRTAIVRELAKDPIALRLAADDGKLQPILDDPDRLVRKTLLTHLSVDAGIAEIGQSLVVAGLSSTDAMTRLASAEVIRQHPDWPITPAVERAVGSLVADLGHGDVMRSGSAGMTLERLASLESVVTALQTASTRGHIDQRAKAALVLWRTKQPFELKHLHQSMQSGSEATRLAVCGLLGRMRSREGVPLLKQALDSTFPAVRTAAVYALRSTAHVADLKPVAKHPKGFDLLALRNAVPVNESAHETQLAAIGVLRNALFHVDANVREKACDALGRVGATESIGLLARLSDDRDPGVRIAAATAVSVLKGSTEDSLVDETEWMKGASARSLRNLNTVYRRPTEVKDGVILAGSDTQLFVDDFVVDEMSEMKRRLHAFKKHERNPVFQAQVPWEEGWADPFMSTVVYDAKERCFKMWYRCGPRHSLKGYAVSEDGIHWRRPNIAATAWHEFEKHNLLGFDGQIGIWKKPGNNVQYNPDAKDPQSRFQSLFYQHEKTYGVSRSSDGITWSQPQAVRPAYGDVVSLITDLGRDRYLFFPKYMRENDGFVRRSFAATTLKKLNDPFTARFPFLAGHREDSLVGDGACRAFGSLLPDTTQLDQFHSEIYSVTAMPYEGVFVALYDLWPVIGNREGPLDMPMKVSRDMQTWTDVDFPRRALSIGQFGEWDSGMVYGANTMLVVDDEIRLYYLGANMGHCTKVLPMTRPYHTLGVGLATLRLDGFASLQPTGEQPGTVTTRPLQIKGDRLVVNANCRADGWLKAELLDAAGDVLLGFTLADCRPVTGDSLGHKVTWRGANTLPTGMPATIRIRFTVKDADLYSFRFGDGSEFAAAGLDTPSTNNDVQVDEN
jgi:HEAT repeat protein